MNTESPATNSLTCGHCAFFIRFTVKAGPTALGQAQDMSECRRFPPSPVPIIGFPLDALSPQPNLGPLIGTGQPPLRKPGQMAVLKPIAAQPVYPAVNETFPICGEFSPNEKVFAQAGEETPDQNDKKEDAGQI